MEVTFSKSPSIDISQFFPHFIGPKTNHLITGIQSEAFPVSQICVANNKVILLREITSKRNDLDPTMGWHLQSLVEGSVLWAQHQCVPAGEGSPSHTRAATSLQYFVTNDRWTFKPDTMCPTADQFCSVVFSTLLWKFSKAWRVSHCGTTRHQGPVARGSSPQLLALWSPWQSKELNGMSVTLKNWNFSFKGLISCPHSRGHTPSPCLYQHYNQKCWKLAKKKKIIPLRRCDSHQKHPERHMEHC